MIRLETSLRNGIKNNHLFEISNFEINWDRRISNEHPNVKRRSNMSSKYNCHGLTFASRRTRIFDAQDINLILRDDGYSEIAQADAVGGDIVLYVADNGDINHSGVVIENSPNEINPQIFSKWGNGSEYIHGVYDRPSVYGPKIKFYRCNR